MLRTIPPATDAKSIHKFMKVASRDMMVPRNFGRCKRTKLPPPLAAMPPYQKRRALKPQDRVNVGMKVNDKVNKAAKKSCPKILAHSGLSNAKSETFYVGRIDILFNQHFA